VKEACVLSRIFRFFLIPILLTAPLLAGGKVFKDTKEYRDPKELKGALNMKFDTYAQMFKEPKGTDCDWVFVDPAFDLASLKGQSIQFYPDNLARSGGWDYGYWGMLAGFYGNGMVSAVEQALRSRGLYLKRVQGQSGGQVPDNPGAAYAQAVTAAANGGSPRENVKSGPPPLNALQLRIEQDRYEEDKKKLGIEEAARRSEEREAKRLKAFAKTQEEAEAKLQSPEDQKGLVLVVYITESNVNTGAAMFFGVVTNTTTGELILLKDGKPLLAARHNSVGAYSGSAPKCGNALATAFDIKTIR
jgi:hypothetical protein